MVFRWLLIISDGTTLVAVVFPLKSVNKRVILDILCTATKSPELASQAATAFSVLQRLRVTIRLSLGVYFESKQKVSWWQLPMCFFVLRWGCCSENMCKWRFRDAYFTHCDCGALTQSMQHLLEGTNRCTREDLKVASESVVKVTKYYSKY